MTRRRHDRALVWFRRDLRDFDHAALHHALADARVVYCAFVFDREILDRLPSPQDRRVEFIWESVRELDAALRAKGGGLVVRHAAARSAIPRLATELKVDAVYCNHDYEPAACDRDAAIAQDLAGAGVAMCTFKDQVIFERDEILTGSGKPFSVFTPYRTAWLRALSGESSRCALRCSPSGRPVGLTPGPLATYEVAGIAGALAPPPAAVAGALPSLEAMGFGRTNLAALPVQPGMSGGAATLADFRDRIDGYRDSRDYPALRGTSTLSVHLRFGTVSIRHLVGWAHACSLQPNGAGAAAWLSELVWREFYAQILWHHPRVVGHAFKPEYDRVAFVDDPERFDAWCRGQTGYPIVDAAMRQLATTGTMHNRLRMVAASFLVKDLLIDWRRGERHFADTLLDYDLASNNGGWQWAASTGCDAQPYFRIFNPVTQSERFDPDGTFIRRHVPEVAALSASEIHAPWRVPGLVQQAKRVVVGRDYPAPIVDHAAARTRALALFAAARG